MDMLSLPLHVVILCWVANRLYGIKPQQVVVYAPYALMKYYERQEAILETIAARIPETGGLCSYYLSKILQHYINEISDQIVTLRLQSMTVIGYIRKEGYK